MTAPHNHRQAVTIVRVTMAAVAIFVWCLVRTVYQHVSVRMVGRLMVLMAKTASMSLATLPWLGLQIVR
jgi:hypothetical protein